ncbi:hypothetical protein FACS189460_4020 [Deltaproteobacteria bacterium]|nr:hypothetical protein FACS189460_4020 [Deltaproteobacteria bacterium]
MTEPQFDLKVALSLIRDKLEAGLPVKLHLGCGTNYFGDWLNIDNNSDNNIEKYDLHLDFSQGLPLADNCADFIYSEHLLEHLEIEAALRLLKDCLRVLKPNGVMRLAMPDLDKVVGYYSDPDWPAAAGLKEAGLGHVRTSAELININFHWWGHKWLYNWEELERRLRESGPVRIERCEWRQSRHHPLRDLEIRPPEASALIAEATKPTRASGKVRASFAAQTGSEGYKLTIVSTTYNHAPYIAQALDSWVSQKTDFPFQVLIADDCSTDGTTDIIRDYAARYPEIIKPVFRDQNLGPVKNGPDLMARIDTEYVAICEGDDFWLDPLKLQKQVDFLETHPECALCFHPVRIFYEDGSKPDEIYPSPDYRFNRSKLILADLLQHNFIQTNSVVFRWRFRAGLNYSDLIPDDILPQDYYLHLIHGETGEIGFLDEVMSAYRRHANGLWRGHDLRQIDFLNAYGLMCLNFYRNLERRFQVDRGSHISSLVVDVFRSYLKVKNWRGIFELTEKYPGYLNFDTLLMLIIEEKQAGEPADKSSASTLERFMEFNLRYPGCLPKISSAPGIFKWRRLKIGAQNMRRLGYIYIRLALLSDRLTGFPGLRRIKVLARHYAASLFHHGDFQKLRLFYQRHPEMSERI